MQLIIKNLNLNLEIKAADSFLNILLKHQKAALKNALFVVINNSLYDLHTPFYMEGKINAEVITNPDDKRYFEVINHTCAHLMAAAIKNLYPNVKFWVGPAIKEGFYYDIDFGDVKIEASDLEAITAEMKSIIANSARLSYAQISHEDAKKLFANDEYKLDLIANITDQLSTYTLDKFTDLCRGPHVIDIKWLKNFKLMSINGAYFKGDAKNKVLTRIHGTCWPSKEALEKYLNILELRKANDHRKIGKEMNLFMFDNLTGQGLATWLPMGMRIYNRISNYIKQVEIKYNFEHVLTPVLGSLDLYKTSGHWKHYRQNLYPIVKIDDEKLLLRPMSCPHHCVIYKNQVLSYRQLPYRLAEEVIQHRYEASGALSGLERVRGMHLTDAHCFVSMQQLYKEIPYLLKMIEEVLSKFKIKIAYYRLSLHDPEDKVSYDSNKEMWNTAENILRTILKKSHYPYREEIGEAAFYGPKIDIQIETALGHEVTMSTLQLDFLAAKNFDLFFMNEKGEKEAPVLLHRGLIGTYERFLSILIEQTSGVFPFWLAPVQIALIPVHPNQFNYAYKLERFFKNKNIFVKNYCNSDRLSYKIRDAQIHKIPYQIILGEEEVKNSTLQIRAYGEIKNQQMNLKEFYKFIKNK